jgi:hypothetical protein
VLRRGRNDRHERHGVEDVGGVAVCAAGQAHRPSMMTVARARIGGRT